jgi:microsomal dipeptidase-like Zn-dependent dipeptidase
MGRWTRGIDYGAGSATRSKPNATPKWCTELEQFTCFSDGLREAGFHAAEVEALTAGNWMRYYKTVFGA